MRKFKMAAILLYIYIYKKGIFIILALPSNV